MNTYTDRYGKEFSFNDHVCMELLIGVPDEKRIGRLVQVRKGVGAFGSDNYILRLRDGGLAAFENVLMRHANDARFVEAFYVSNGKTPPVIPPQEPYPDDTTDTEYSIGNKYPETGFVVSKPKQPDSETQSFSMMVIKPKGGTS